VRHLVFPVLLGYWSSQHRRKQRLTRTGASIFYWGLYIRQTTSRLMTMHFLVVVES